MPQSTSTSLSTALADTQIVLCDPPWRYGRDAKSNGWTGSARKHYPAMTKAQLCDMEVGRHTADDGVVLMWAVGSKLGEAVSIIEAWGYSYKGVLLTWIKTDKKTGKRPVMGLGRYTRSSTEFLLFGTKGKVQNAQIVTGATTVSGLLFHARGRHSAKPKETYDRIEQVFGGAGTTKRVELFARPSNPPPSGWCGWGNEWE
jgi:N6-adenosine-specific RNA methylase IME4